MFFTLNGLDYEIIESDNCAQCYLTDDSNYMDSGQLFGSCDNALQKIYIHKRLPLHNKIRILAHEVTHAVIYAYGLDREEFTQEDMCEFVASHFQTINRIVFSYFNGKEKDSAKCK